MGQGWELPQKRRDRLDQALLFLRLEPREDRKRQGLPLEMLRLRTIAHAAAQGGETKLKVQRKRVIDAGRQPAFLEFCHYLVAVRNAHHILVVNVVIAVEFMRKRYPSHQSAGLEKQAIAVGAKAPLGVPSLEMRQYFHFIPFRSTQ